MPAPLERAAEPRIALVELVAPEVQRAVAPAPPSFAVMRSATRSTGRLAQARSTAEERAAELGAKVVVVAELAERSEAQRESRRGGARSARRARAPSRATCALAAGPPCEGAGLACACHATGWSAKS